MKPTIIKLPKVTKVVSDESGHPAMCFRQLLAPEVRDRLEALLDFRERTLTPERKHEIQNRLQDKSKRKQSLN